MISRLKRFTALIKNKIKSFFRRTYTSRRQIGYKLWQAIYFTGTLALSGYVLQYFLPLWLAGAILSTFFVHEMGHYITALREKRKVDLPFFVPFIWGVAGATRIYDRGSYPESDARIHMAGPSWGFLWAIAGAAVAAWYGFAAAGWAFLWLAVFNLWHGTFGSDGRFYAAMKKEMESNGNHYSERRPEVIYGPVGSGSAEEAGLVSP